MKTAFQIAVSKRPWVHVDALRPPRMPLGLIGQGAYKSSTGPRGGLIVWAYSGNLRTTDGKGEVKFAPHTAVRALSSVATTRYG